MEREPEPTVVYYDGVCGLCNRLVDFVIHRDPKARFRFAALQTPRGERAAARVGLPVGELHSVIVEDGGALLVRSDAVLRVWRRLGFPWSALAAAGAIVPRPIRDAMYRFVARRRYGWFGKSDTCRVPTPAERARFLE